MSFHEAGSELMRLNCEAWKNPITVDGDTFTVLALALAIGSRSRGLFDITVAGGLVKSGLLPRPKTRRAPDPRASWRDIELMRGNRVRFRRPLWIDLGGIAKGYAVDKAVAAMALPKHVQASVNAGGDLRIVGPNLERVLLRAPLANGMVAVVELQDGSIASSSGRDSPKSAEGRAQGPHVNGITKKPVGTRSFASVIAPECVIADALTKIVLARGVRSAPVLRSFGASAYLHTPRLGWRSFGANDEKT
jgi:thiamine biosynthesis lipoprotein